MGKNHDWSYDFVERRTHDNKKIRMLTIIDEFTRECLAIVVARYLRSNIVLHKLAELFVERGPPNHVRSDTGLEFTAHDLVGLAHVAKLLGQHQKPNLGLDILLILCHRRLLASLA